MMVSERLLDDVLDVLELVEVRHDRQLVKADAGSPC